MICSPSSCSSSGSRDVSRSHGLQCALNHEFSSRIFVLLLCGAHACRCVQQRVCSRCAFPFFGQVPARAAGHRHEQVEALLWVLPACSVLSCVIASWSSLAIIVCPSSPGLMSSRSLLECSCSGRFVAYCSVVGYHQSTCLIAAEVVCCSWIGNTRANARVPWSCIRLADSASTRMLASKMKICTSQYKLLHGEMCAWLIEPLTHSWMAISYMEKCGNVTANTVSKAASTEILTS